VTPWLRGSEGSWPPEEENVKRGLLNQAQKIHDSMFSSLIAQTSSIVLLLVVAPNSLHKSGTRLSSW
jgi:hypothetical protein